MYPEQHDEQAEAAWFALQVKLGLERNIATLAGLKGFEQFLPLYKVRRRWSDRMKELEVPLFPGYLFCRLDPALRYPLLTIPGVLGFVGIGKKPAPVDDAEIEALQSVVRSGLPMEPWNYLEVGQRVCLQDGPFEGVEGILIEVRKRSRVVVSVTLLQRSIAVEIEREWVQPREARHMVASALAAAAR